MGYYYTHYKRSSNSSLYLTLFLIALSLMSDHHIHVVARHLTGTSLSDDLPEVPDTEVPDDSDNLDDPVDENPVPAATEIPMYPQPDLPEVPGDMTDLLPSPELPLPAFTTAYGSAQAGPTSP